MRLPAPFHALLLPGLLLAGCGGLPGSGPDLATVVAASSRQAGNPGQPGAPRLSYALLTLDHDIVAALEEDRFGQRFSAALTASEPGEVRIGVGDVLGITIFERQTGGLFIPADAGARPGNFVQLPPQQVDREGNVTIPFAGALRAVGRTPAQLERAIAASLSRLALEPQAVVSMTDRRSSSVSVVGDVGQSLRFTLDPGGERLLGAIARAGGTRFAPHETMVTLQRAGQVEQAMLSDIVTDPRMNLPLAGEDTIVVSREQRYFLALGAVGMTASVTQLNRRFPFEDRRLTLADGLARAGGLQDDRANPGAVFLFRQERRGNLRRMGLDVAELGETVPTVYRADLANPSSFFLAQRFPMRHDDLIYVSNAPSVDLLKFLQVVLPVTQAGANIRAITR